MSPAWPTVKLVSVPAEAPSVFELSDDGVEASCVICDRSSVTACGDVEPFGGLNVRLSDCVPPVETLPAPLNTIGPAPLTATPAAVVVSAAHHSLQPLLI